MIFNLVYIPEEKVVEAYESIVCEKMDEMVQDGNLTAEMDEFLQTCETNYVGGRGARSGRRRAPRYPISMTNKVKAIQNSIPITNNKAEAFNKVITYDMERSIVFWNVLNAFIREEAKAKKEWMDSVSRRRSGDQCDVGNNKRKLARKEKYLRIKNIIEKFDKIPMKDALASLVEINR